MKKNISALLTSLFFFALILGRFVIKNDIIPFPTPNFRVLGLLGFILLIKKTNTQIATQYIGTSVRYKLNQPSLITFLFIEMAARKIPALRLLL